MKNYLLYSLPDGSRTRLERKKRGHVSAAGTSPVDHDAREGVMDRDLPTPTEPASIRDIHHARAEPPV